MEFIKLSYSMEVKPIAEVYGAYLIEFDRFADERGYFQEVYSTARKYPHFVGQQRQINLSSSQKGTVRGLHVVPFAKLCSCPKGRLYDVVADVREGSPTYLQWYGVWLDEHSKRQLFVPGGCAHGFFAAEDNTLLLYLQDGTYDPSVEKEINWKDPKLNIRWPDSQQYFLSEKDKRAAFM